MKIDTFISVCLLWIGQWSAFGADLNWQLPFEVAEQQSIQTGKPMLVFVGKPSDCKDSKEFIQTVCSQAEFTAFARESLICTQVLDQRTDTKEERWKKSRIVESLNVPNAHAVIIANAKGRRIGELSTTPKSIGEFINDIKTIVAKAPPEGRLKYSEVGMFYQKFVPEKTYAGSPLPAFSREPLKGRYLARPFLGKYSSPLAWHLDGTENADPGGGVENAFHPG